MIAIRLSDEERDYLSQNPQALQILIDHHSRHEVEGDAMGCDVSHRFDRIKQLRAVREEAIQTLEEDYESEADRFLAIYEPVKHKAAQARDIYKEITKTKGCDDTFTIQDGWITWEGTYREGCHCHPEWLTGKFEMSLQHLLELDLSAYRESLIAAKEEEASKVRRQEEAKAAKQRQEQEFRERQQYEQLKSKYGIDLE